MSDILMIDCGSRYGDKIVEQAQRLNCSLDRVKYDSVTYDFVKNSTYKAMIISGSPFSCYKEGSPSVDKKIYTVGIPVLGICYGAQLTALLHGKKVAQAEAGEHGFIKTELYESELFSGISSPADMYMSHGDRIYELPEGFKLIAKTADCPIAGMEYTEKKIYCTQFHPECGEDGDKVVENFLLKICKIKPQK